VALGHQHVKASRAAVGLRAVLDINSFEQAITRFRQAGNWVYGLGVDFDDAGAKSGAIVEPSKTGYASAREENAMTQQEIEDELKSLREQEQARRKNWRPIRRSAAIGAAVFLLAGIGLFVFSFAYQNLRHETFPGAMMFLILSLNMSLLSQALRDPI
jgi:hypothetical protein